MRSDADMPTDIGHDFGGDFHAAAMVCTAMPAFTPIMPAAIRRHADQAAHHGSTWLFGVLSFRTITAALAFFGLAGLAAQSAEASPPMVLLVALRRAWPPCTPSIG